MDGLCGPGKVEEGQSGLEGPGSIAGDQGVL